MVVSVVGSVHVMCTYLYSCSSIVTLWNCTHSWTPFYFSFFLFLRRIPISATFIEMLIGRLRSDDLYNQVTYSMSLFGNVIKTFKNKKQFYIAHLFHMFNLRHTQSNEVTVVFSYALLSIIVYEHISVSSISWISGNYCHRLDQGVEA